MQAEQKMSNISKSLLKAQQLIKYASKDGKNSFSNYTYASAEKIVLLARNALAEAGLVVGREQWFFEVINEQMLKVENHFFVLHAETGEKWETTAFFPAIVKKGTPADKALACALTTSLSYFLRDLLLIPRFSQNEIMDARKDYANETSINKKLKEIKIENS